jgi:hypothetical protein
MFCPILVTIPGGPALVMQRAKPLSEEEAEHRRETNGFLDCDYVPPDEGDPFEPKASDRGRLPNGRLVGLDYSTPAW